MDIQNCTSEEISDLREIRKLLDILTRYGDVLVSGGYHALTRFKYLMNKFIDKGETTESVSDLIENLNEVGFPVKSI